MYLLATRKLESLEVPFPVPAESLTDSRFTKQNISAQIAHMTESQERKRERGGGGKGALAGKVV